MAENNFVNLFGSSYDAISMMRKKYVVEQIKILNGKLVFVKICKIYIIKFQSFQRMVVILLKINYAVSF